MVEVVGGCGSCEVSLSSGILVESFVMGPGTVYCLFGTSHLSVLSSSRSFDIVHLQRSATSQRASTYFHCLQLRVCRSAMLAIYVKHAGSGAPGPRLQVYGEQLKVRWNNVSRILFACYAAF